MRFSAWLGAAALVLASANLVSGSALAANPMPATTNPTVALGVSGTEQAMPDIATISAGLETRGAAADTAMADNVRDFAKIMAVVKKYGIQPKDIQTTGVSVGEDFDYSGREAKLNGYKASNSLSIKVRDLKQVGPMLSDLVAAGANQVGGPTFGMDDSEALRDKARGKAFDSAQGRALAYARKAGFRSVRLLSINEGAGDMAFAYATDAAAGAAAAETAGAAMKIDATSIEPGLVSETVFANFIFEMVP
jgi:uncharacterized protein